MASREPDLQTDAWVHVGMLVNRVRSLRFPSLGGSVLDLLLEVPLLAFDHDRQAVGPDLVPSAVVRIGDDILDLPAHRRSYDVVELDAVLVPIRMPR